MKLNIDMRPDPNADLMSPGELAWLTSGVYDTMNRLGSLAEYVASVKISWVELPNPKDYRGPLISFFLKTINGVESSHTADFRFFGGKAWYIQGKIAAHFADPNCLPKKIRQHIKNCRMRLQDTLDSLPANP